MKVKIKGPNVNGKIMIDRPEWIELKCFPQQVRFEVENECR